MRSKSHVSLTWIQWTSTRPALELSRERWNRMMARSPDAGLSDRVVSGCVYVSGVWGGGGRRGISWGPTLLQCPVSLGTTNCVSIISSSVKYCWYDKLLQRPFSSWFSCLISCTRFWFCSHFLHPLLPVFSVRCLISCTRFGSVRCLG